MRSHGEPRFPDPNSQGNFLLSGPEIGPPNSPAYLSANKACGHLLPKSAPLTAAQQRQDTVQALKFVTCMRSHGIANFPDPVVNAEGVEFNGRTSVRPNSPVFQSAQRACQKLMPGGPP
jgi:hypothetical protein